MPCQRFQQYQLVHLVQPFLYRARFNDATISRNRFNYANRFDHMVNLLQPFQLLTVSTMLRNRVSYISRFNQGLSWAVCLSRAGPGRHF